MPRKAERKPGRPRKYGVSFHTALPAWLKAEIDTFAKSQGVGQAEVIECWYNAWKRMQAQMKSIVTEPYEQKPGG